MGARLPRARTAGCVTAWTLGASCLCIMCVMILWTLTVVGIFSAAMSEHGGEGGLPHFPFHAFDMPRSHPRHGQRRGDDQDSVTDAFGDVGTNIDSVEVVSDKPRFSFGFDEPVADTFKNAAADFGEIDEESVNSNQVMV